MTQSTGNSDVLAQQCTIAVDLLLQQHRWQLLDREEFWQLTWHAIQHDAFPNARSAALNTYSQVLYAACGGTQGNERQNLAYTDLYHYLYAVAHKSYRDVAAEASQIAIERVFEKFMDCQQPETFLAFAFQQLRDAVRTLRREQTPAALSLDAPIGVGNVTLGESIPDRGRLALDRHVELIELRTRCEQLLAEVKREHPDAVNQVEAFCLKHWYGLPDDHIRKQLGIKDVYSARSRGKILLESTPRLRALAVEFNILPGQS